MLLHHGLKEIRNATVRHWMNRQRNWKKQHFHTYSKFVCILCKIKVMMKTKRRNISTWFLVSVNKMWVIFKSEINDKIQTYEKKENEMLEGFWKRECHIWWTWGLGAELPLEIATRGGHLLLSCISWTGIGFWSLLNKAFLFQLWTPPPTSNWNKSWRRWYCTKARISFESQRC